jgi:arsenate reductase
MKKSDRKLVLTRVMFVCLGNACRSPMAEAIAWRIANDVIGASSAGLIPLGFVAEMTRTTLIKNGYRVDGLESKPILMAALEAVDLVVNMSGRPREIAFENPDKVEDWFVEDPYGAGAEVYQRIFEDIERRVAELADRLRNGKSRWGMAGGIPRTGKKR